MRAASPLLSEERFLVIQHLIDARPADAERLGDGSGPKALRDQFVPVRAASCLRNARIILSVRQVLIVLLQSLCRGRRFVSAQTETLPSWLQSRRPRWQALRRPGPAGRTAGASVLQRSKRQRQRSWKAQPGGKCCRSGGCPGMVRSSAAMAVSRRGVARNKPYV